MAVSDFGHRARPSRRRGTMAAAAADHTALNKPFSGRTARRQGFREPHRDTRTVADDDRPEQTIFAAVDVLAERAREVMLITRLPQRTFAAAQAIPRRLARSAQGFPERSGLRAHLETRAPI